MMKCFVYNKKDNKTIAIIKNVRTVEMVSRNQIMFITEQGETFLFDTRE